MINFSLLSMAVWYIQALFRLNPRWWCACLLWVLVLLPSKASSDIYDSTGTHGRHAYSAIVNITYKDSKTGENKSEKIDGKYGLKSLVESETGIVVHVRSKTPEGPVQNNGCYPNFENEIPSQRWVALIERGSCHFSAKIQNAAQKYNASAVVIYNNKSQNPDAMVSMDHEEIDVVAIFIKRSGGLRIAQLLEEGTKVTMHIAKGQLIPDGGDETSNISKTSVLFVSISFIVLMIISLAWLVFYYIQRFRYAHAKERLSRRLASAAKKAISKIPQRTVRTGDKELDSDYDQCAVCIEGYKNSDVIRILPCKHVYHKSCVDPWLMDQRSCPMCKMDILRAYGMQIQLHGSQDSMVAADPESGTVSGVMDEVEPSSSPEELGAVGGVKIVHFTHPSIQYHPRSMCADGCSGLDPGAEPSTSKQAVSEDNGQLSDCECNELESLMKDTHSGSGKDTSSLQNHSLS